MHRFVIGLMLVLAACTETVTDEAVSVCQPLCRCFDTPLPSAQRECSATCVTQYEQRPLSEACVACVSAHANHCTNLIADCTSACMQATPLQSYGVRNEPGIEDR